MELASTLWLQLLIMFVATACIYGIIEFYRRFLFISCYLIILFNCGLLPFAFGDHSIFFTSKWLVLCPVVLVASLWRISYYKRPSDNVALWRKILLIPSEFLFCTKSVDNKSSHPPTAFMEWLIFLIYFTNIIIAVLSNISTGNISNSVCGIILALTLPLPAKILYNEHGYMIDCNENNNLLDIIALNQSPEWILSYISWNICFLWDYAPKSIFWTTLHLGPCLVRSFINKSYYLFMMSRLVCLVIVFWVQTPSAKHEGILPWIFDGTQFKDIVYVSHQRLIFEIWGAINLIIALIHTVKWIKWIRNKRKEDKIMNNVAEQQKMSQV